MRLFRSCWLSLVALVPLLVVFESPSLARTRYYIVVRSVEQAPGVETGLSAELKKLLIAELKKRPEVSLELPGGITAESDEKDILAVLREKKLKAYTLTL